ncbi:MAG: hypothetical protein NVS9B4_00990 [Candidatus Acidiferrum sp.]
MATITFSGKQVLGLGHGLLDRNAWTIVGSAAITKVIKRIKTEHRNVSDSSAKAYSPNGPIYVPVTGKSRTKASLGGREMLSRFDIHKARSFGSGGQFGRTAHGRTPTANGSVTPSGKSIKFANYAAYKKFLGKSGDRDLELSGKMLNNIDILAISDTSVEIGFKSSEQEAKMLGNIRVDDEWGFSPSDAKAILDLVASYGLRHMQAIWSGRAS